jgi:hypothetical protein
MKDIMRNDYTIQRLLPCHQVSRFDTEVQIDTLRVTLGSMGLPAQIVLAKMATNTLTTTPKSTFPIEYLFPDGHLTLVPASSHMATLDGSRCSSVIRLE